MTETAKLLALHAIEDGTDAKTLYFNVLENAEMIEEALYSGTSFIRICINVFKQQSINRTASQVALLVGASKLLKPIYDAQVREVD